MAMISLKKCGLLLWGLAFTWLAVAQTTAVYPTHWFTGMKWNKVQLLIHSPGINQNAPTAKISYPGVTLKQTTRTESKNYLVLDVVIAPTAKPGKMDITIKTGNLQKTIPFELKARRKGMGTTYANGVNSSDFVYLIMPDRFANGDSTNDRISGYRDTISDRTNPSAHHGGDMQGVVNHLGYLKEMGVTAIWMCPVIENDMPWKQESQGAISGYHGYWITNHYKIDKRYGGEAAYRKLIANAHKEGIKVIQDAVYNHVGDEHFLYRDQPFADMFNQWPAYTGSNHREETLLSNYTSAIDKKVMLDGWFTPHLPDLNLRNTYMANFLIQNSIWCTEEFGIDGWRVDTYKYCDEAFMNKINAALLADFPTLSIFGEAWANTVTGSAYFTENNMAVAFKHNLPGTTDFPMQSAMLSAINQSFGWTEGVNKLMMTLAQDVLYKDPKRNCIFLDNHDVDRYLTMIGGDLNKWKMGIGLLLTLRGIPQLYYGTEVLLQNDPVNGDGKKRNDFPGGFAGDAANKFTAAGRSTSENEAFTFVSKLANFRKQSKALTVGTTTQYLPQDGVFVFARQHKGETVLVVLNQNNAPAVVDASRFRETLQPYQMATDVYSGAQLATQNKWNVPAQTIWVLSLK